ncbi:hypothetical protein Goshw_021446 [Gossypium schwendimanii]|uniref:HAT C-terminal dimerisation domain-containing protein n=1 Tax=Gossypium schwendimanii TaxID=34291 RepID=A0A7J9LXF5_GOSSC|nr:hypothetical protein [Gossypium schwendimanii]
MMRVMILNDTSSIQYHELSLLACDLLTIPLSTVAFELTFNMWKEVIAPLKISLNPKTVQFKPLFALMIGCELRDFQRLIIS